MGASVLTQRRGLLASLEELRHELHDLPKDLAAQLSKKRALYEELEQLCALLARGGQIALPSVRAIVRWSNISALSSPFTQTGAHRVGASAVSTTAKSLLKRASRRTPETHGVDWREFPIIPRLVRAIGVGVASEPFVFLFALYSPSITSASECARSSGCGQGSAVD